MKKVLFSALAIACFTALYSFVPGIKTLVTDDYKVNTEHSKIDWVGSKKEGYHPGTFMLKSGNLNVENGRITKGQFVIDMANLKVTDKAGVKLEGHLKADDFFDVAKHPEAIFEIENVNYTSETAVELTGTLTIKGIKVPIKFPGIVRGVSDKKLFAQAFFSLDSRLLPITDKYAASDVQIMVYLYANK